MLKIFVVGILIFFQPAHITMTSIDYVPGTDSLKVLVRIDYEHFLRDYQQTIDDDLSLQVLRGYKPFPAELTNKYINLKLFIYINKKLIIGKLVNAEVSHGTIRLNILYRPERKLNSLTVRNTFLTGLFSDVENLTIIRISDFETGIKFTQKHVEERFVLK